MCDVHELGQPRSPHDCIVGTFEAGQLKVEELGVEVVRCPEGYRQVDVPQWVLSHGAMKEGFRVPVGS